MVGRLNQTLGGDFLNGRITNQVETSPLPIVAGQGGLVIVNQPGGLGLSTANLFAPEIITNFTQIYLYAPHMAYRPLLRGLLHEIIKHLKTKCEIHRDNSFNNFKFNSSSPCPLILCAPLLVSPSEIGALVYFITSQTPSPT